MAAKRSALVPLFAGILLVVLLNTWFAVASLRTVRRNEYWLQHTWQVIGQVERIVSHAREGESGARGFVITGDEKFLVPYYIARHDIFADIATFEQLTADNARQRPNGARMSGAAQARFASLDRIVQVRRQQGLEASAAIVSQGEGLRQMAELRSAGDAMEDEERRLLTIREADVRHSSGIALFAIGLASGLDLLLLVFIGRYLLNERRLRLQGDQVNAQLAAAKQQVEQNAAVIQKLNEDLEERVRMRTAELESTNRELEAFSYSVSHDLRAPLRTIDGFSLALEEDYHDVVGDTGRDYIARVRSGVQRMGGLIDALLQLSRITRSELVRQPIDMTALTESVAANLRAEHPEQVMQITVEPGMEANADPDLVRVALENLLGNAVKFSSKVPVSIISVSKDPATGTFQVADNGAGFDMYYSSKLFNAFNRLHGDRDFKGSGIGLATVARVIRRHGGTISASSEVGHGARFFFTLG